MSRWWQTAVLPSTRNFEVKPSKSRIKPDPGENYPGSWITNSKQRVLVMLFKWPLDCDVCMCGIHTLLLLCLFETRPGSSCLGLPTAIDGEAAPHLTYALCF